MRKLLPLIILPFVINNLEAQIKLTVYPDSLFSTYYHQRLSLFKSLPQTKNDIVFIGNSITDGGEWNELFNDFQVKNRGISGDVSAGVLKRIDEVVKRKPAKVFLMIGVNDLARGVVPDSVVKNILLIAGYLKEQSPSTKLFIESILPVNDIYKMFPGHTGKALQIKQVNNQLEQKANEYKFTFIDLYTSFCNEEGKLRPELSNDGLHLKGEGYLLWKHLVFPYVYDLQTRPSLLPMPQRMRWDPGYFRLYNCKTIIIASDSLYHEANHLQKYLSGKGWQHTITNKEKNKELFIELRIDKINSPSLPAEAYKLEVTEEKILVAANTTHGIFNGIQTLKQLIRDGSMIDACEIIDWPAFSWRGFMIDVGRNYMSVALLKQQIEVMSQYKLNVFHFHATEDIAWRIAIKQYPQLTAPENMLRNKGQYYSETEIKELIDYCKERHIEFVPEIDMPGHSAAFRKAMKTDMQSDSGLRYVKDILKEFSDTYDVPYIHIGADEVKITNKDFIPAVTKYLQSLGKIVIGWQPGGNFTGNTIRQLWMDDNAHLSANTTIQYIDSRHLYLNHMDPLESVVTIFNRKIGDKEKGDASLLGGTICMWHDRTVSNENDILKMNPVYPAMLAFAERSWRGGGQTGWIANISDGDEKAFMEFENRILDNQQVYFNDKSFPYAKQTAIKWSLYGPYDNGGDLLKKFELEASPKNFDTTRIYKQLTGGTIVLRHWWAPLIKGAVKEAKENTTWYAITKIWCVDDGINNFWIGFNNLSRSPATDSPPLNAWDNKGSAVWVNGKLIEPPQWKHGEQKGNSEIPLIDEGYEFREPTKIFLQKGWNTVLIKAPIGSFIGKDWQNPVKWMFTFLHINNELND